MPTIKHASVPHYCHYKRTGQAYVVCHWWVSLAVMISARSGRKGRVGTILRIVPVGAALGGSVGLAVGVVL